jgi:prepilin-type N-terminal cleavage/methylation domain-containing protein
MNLQRKQGSRGFSLIELLIVITIIAILSSVVIMSIQIAKTKGADNSVKSMMKQIANQAENYRTSTGILHFGIDVSSTGSASCVGGVFDDPVIDNIEAGIVRDAAVGATLSCTTDSSGANWSVLVSALRGGGTWCVDSQGGYKASVTNLAGLCQ